MHHLSDLSVVPLPCVRPVLSRPCVGKQRWKHVHVPFDLYSGGDTGEPCRRCLVECLQGLGGDPCLPVIPLLSPFKHLL